MSFRQRKLAREAMEADIRLENGGETIIAPYAEGDADLAGLEKQVDGQITLVAEGEVLEQDTETVEAFDEKINDEDVEVSEEEAETIQIATESIARRWAIKPSRKLAKESFGRDRKSNRVLAREGLGDTLGGMWDAFIEWLKELWDNARELWKKYVNAGKSLQTQAKANEKVLENLGTKSKDQIKGGFIKQLSAGKDFVGNDLSILNGYATNSCDPRVIEGLTETALTMFSKAESGKGVEAAKEATAEGSKEVEAAAEKITKKDAFLGGEYLKTVTTPAKDDSAESITLQIKSADKADFETEVDTPDVGRLRELNDLMADFGKELEKFINKFRKVESSRKRALDSVEKFKRKVDKEVKDGDADAKKEARLIKAAANFLIRSATTADTIQGKNRNNLAKGLSGFIRAGISAYKKDA